MSICGGYNINIIYITKREGKIVQMEISHHDPSVGKIQAKNLSNIVNRPTHHIYSSTLNFPLIIQCNFPNTCNVFVPREKKKPHWWSDEQRVPFPSTPWHEVCSLWLGLSVYKLPNVEVWKRLYEIVKMLWLMYVWVKPTSFDLVVTTLSQACYFPDITENMGSNTKHPFVIRKNWDEHYNSRKLTIVIEEWWYKAWFSWFW